MSTYKPSARRRRAGSRKSSSQASRMLYQPGSGKKRLPGVAPSHSLGVHPPLASVSPPEEEYFFDDEYDGSFDLVDTAEEMDYPTSGSQQYDVASRAYPPASPVSTGGMRSSNAQAIWNAPGNGLGRLRALRELAGGSRRQRKRRARRDQFHWREREWGSRLWVQRLRLMPSLAVTLILVIIVSFFAFVVATKAASKAVPPSHNAKTTVVPVIIQQPGGDSGPTPTLPAYTVGVWVSSMSPGSSGTIQVFVRVSQNSGTTYVSNAPVAGVPVTISATYGSVSGGAVKTDVNGLATFNLSYSAPGGSPVYLTATATIGGQQYTSTTVFVAG